MQERAQEYSLPQQHEMIDQGSVPAFNPHSSAYSYDIGQSHPTGYPRPTNPAQPLNAFPIANNQLPDNCFCGPDCQCLGCLSHYLMATNPTMAHVLEVWQLQATEAYMRESEQQQINNQGLLLQQPLPEQDYSQFPAQPPPVDEQYFMPVYVPQSQSSCCGHPEGLCKCGDG